MAEPNARLSGVKQELSVFKSEFSSSFEKLKDSITVQFSDINARLDKIGKAKKKVTEEVNESIMSIKNTIINAVKEENLKLQNKCKKLDEQLERRNNLKIQGIPANVTDDELEGK